MMTKKEFMSQCKEPGYVIRTCNKDMESYGGFIWPKKGFVIAPDWLENNECGNGLHGLLNGEGNMLTHVNGVYHIVIVDKTKCIDLGGKVKFNGCYIHYCGDRVGAWAELHRLVGNRMFYNAILTAGYRSTLTAGDVSTLTAGSDSTLIAGNSSTLTAGYRSTLTADYRSTLTAGSYSTLTADYSSTLTAGSYSTLIAGNSSTLTAGSDSTLIAGNSSTLTAGDVSTLTAGSDSTLTAGSDSTLTAGSYSTLIAGIGSTLTWKYYDNKRYRLHTIYIGENGIKPDTPYYGYFHGNEFIVGEKFDD